MAFKIPIQQRETIDIQSGNPVMDSSADRITPLDTEGITSPLSGLAKIYKKRADDLEIKTEQFATTDFENKVNASVNENLAKVLAAKGENAFVEADRAQKKLRYDIDQSIQKTPEKYREKFKLIADREINQFDRPSMGHQYKEQNAVADAVEKQNALDISDRAVLDVYDQSAYLRSIEELKQKVEISTRRKLGGDPNLGVPASPEVQKVIDLHNREAVSLVHSNAIKSLVANEDMDKAEGLAKWYKKDITAKDMLEVNAILAKGRKNDETNAAFALMNEAMKRNPGDPIGAHNYIRDNSGANGKLYNKARMMYSAEVGLKETLRIQQAHKQLGAVMGEIRKNKGQYSIKDITKNLDPEFHDEAIRFAQSEAQGKNVIRDVKTYNMLNEAYHNQPERFIQLMTNANSYRGRLPKEDISEFESKLKEVQDPVTNRMTVRDFSYIRDRIVKDTVATKFNPKDDEYKKEAANIDAQLSKVFRDVKASMPERSSKEEIAKAVEHEMYLKIHTEEGKYWWSKDKTVFTPNVTQLFSKYPPARVDKMRSLIEKSLGKSVDDETVLKALKYQDYELSK